MSNVKYMTAILHGLAMCDYKIREGGDAKKIA